MALEQYNINTRNVSAAIGYGSDNVGELCTSPTINKWSKFKPVNDKTKYGTPNWGLTIPFGTLNAISLFDWTYLPRLNRTELNPNGGYIIEQFRQYEHNAAIPLIGEFKQTLDSHVRASFLPPIEFSPIGTYNISMSEILSAWTEWHYGVRITAPNGKFVFAVSPDDIKPAIPIPMGAGIHFDLNNVLFYGTGVCEYVTFLTPTYDGLLSFIGVDDPNFVAFNDQALLVLPNGTGSFTKIAVPTDYATVGFFYSVDVVDAGIGNIEGEINIGSAGVTYRIRNVSGYEIALSFAMTITDVNDNILDVRTFQVNAKPIDDGTYVRVFSTRITAEDGHLYSFSVTLV